MLRLSSRVLGGLLAFLVLSVPSALTESGTGVTGITLQAAPGAISVQWTAPSGLTIDHYTVSYAKSSIIENNGRFDDQEETVGTETSLLLLDLANRGFQNGDLIFVTVTATDIDENVTPVIEEKSLQVQLASTSVASASSAQGTFGLLHAIAESATSVKLEFSTPITLPEQNPAAHFAITEKVTTNAIGIISAVVSGEDVTLTTLPMIPRGRYVVAFSDAVTAVDGSILDPAKRTIEFLARGEDGASSFSSSSSSSSSSISIPPLLDTTAPEAPTNLTLRKVLQKNGLYTVHASWRESLNSEGDLIAYNLYESSDEGKTFTQPTAVQATITSTTFADVPPGTFTLKVTARDEVPNESAGTEETIILPETGAALTLFLSLAGAAGMSMKRKKKHYPSK